MPPARKKAAAKKAEEKTEESVDRSSQEMTESEETQAVAKEAVPEYKPTHPTLENAGLDQHAAEEQRQAELTAQRNEHNVRTGDASR